MVDFINSDNWKGSGKEEGISFKQIVLQHINRCVRNGSVEWHGGYWQEKQAGTYGIERIYVQNTRDVFCNSVRVLRALLLCYYDDESSKADENINKRLDELEKNKQKTDKKEYNLERVDIYMDLFEELILLGKRLNFFEEREYIDEDTL